MGGVLPGGYTSLGVEAPSAQMGQALVVATGVRVDLWRQPPESGPASGVRGRLDELEVGGAEALEEHLEVVGT